MARDLLVFIHAAVEIVKQALVWPLLSYLQLDHIIKNCNLFSLSGGRMLLYGARLVSQGES